MNGLYPGKRKRSKKRETVVRMTDTPDRESRLIPHPRSGPNGQPDAVNTLKAKRNAKRKAQRLRQALYLARIDLLEAALTALGHAGFGEYLYRPEYDKHGLVRGGCGRVDILNFAAASSACLAVVQKHIDKTVMFMNPRARQRPMFQPEYATISHNDAYLKMSRMPQSVRHVTFNSRVMLHALAKYLPNVLSLRSKAARRPYIYDCRVRDLPPLLEHLHLGCKFSLDRCVFPPSIKKMTLHAGFQNTRLWEHPMPEGLEELTLIAGDHPARSFFGFSDFPHSLEKLTVIGSVCFSTDLPPRLRELSWICDWSSENGADFFAERGCFFAAFDRLPPTLQTLCLPMLILSELDGQKSFPPGLLSLEIGFVSGPIPSFPEGLIKLHLGGGDYASMPPLPSSVLYLGVPKCAFEALPRGLIALVCKPGYDHPLPSLPDTLQAVHLDDSYSHGLVPIERRASGGDRVLPASLTQFRAGDAFDADLGPLPAGIETICIGATFDRPLPDIPPSLTHLCLGHSFDRDLALPRGLTSLKIGNAFDRPLGCLLPPRLERLELGLRFNQPLGRLPETLRDMILGDSFNHPLGPLPDKLEFLVIGDSFNQSFTPHADTSSHPGGSLTGDARFECVSPLPPNLTTLKLGNAFNHPIAPLPGGLVNLILGESYTHRIFTLPDSIGMVFCGPNYSYQTHSIKTGMMCEGGKPLETL